DTDGLPQSDVITFPTIGLSVNPVGESGFNQTLFALQPDPSNSYLASDEAIWQPCSGFNNFLGELSFEEFVSPSAAKMTVPLPALPGLPSKLANLNPTPPPTMTDTQVLTLDLGAGNLPATAVPGPGCGNSNDKAALAAIAKLIFAAVDQAAQNGNNNI